MIPQRIRKLITNNKAEFILTFTIPIVAQFIINVASNSVEKYPYLKEIKNKVPDFIIQNKIGITSIIIIFFYILLKFIWDYYLKSKPIIAFNNDEFAYYTITSRFKTIENNVSKSTNIKLTSYRDQEMRNADILSGLTNNINHDIVKQFKEDCEKYSPNTIEFYNTAPFLFVEHYFYYHLLRSYSDNNRQGYQHPDPYNYQKIEEMKGKYEKAGENNSVTIKDAIDNFSNERYKLSDLLRLCVNANTADLSQVESKANHNICSDLHSNTSEVCSFFEKQEKEKLNISIIVDNIGIELLTDILLALYLLENKFVNTVTFHTKELPMYVSDVIHSDTYGNDFEKLISFLEEKDNNSKLVINYKKYKENKKLIIKSSIYWNMPYSFIKTKKFFDEEVKGCSDLIIVKGDLNYRKLVEDRQWDYYRKYNKAVKKYNYSILALRAIKSSVIIGLDTEEATKIRNNLEGYNGKYGTIQFYENKDKSKKLFQ